MHQTKAWWPWVATLILSFIGCSSGSESNDSPKGSAAANTDVAAPSSAPSLSAKQRRILGFEDSGPTEWTSEDGKLSRSTLFTEGTSALSVQLLAGRAEVCSGPLSLPWKQYDSLGFQLWMEKRAAASGEVQVLLRPASRGAAPIELPPVSLDDQAPGAFRRVTFPLKGEARTLDDGAQVQVCIAFDAGAGRYVLDDIQLHMGTRGEDEDDRIVGNAQRRVGVGASTGYADCQG